MSQQKEIGTLVVVVLKAQHLHQPSFYKQDPYAQASLSGLTKRTKVDPKGGQHPVWDDELRFPVLADVGKDRANRILEVSCHKDEQRGDDVLLGKGTVDIEETLKTGEFDDWVPLETSGGARGEVYLEMTFYANSPPPLTRRPSKLSPSDRLARPAAYYFTQGRQLTPKSTSPIASPQPGRSPVPGERKSRPSPASGGQIPSSLIPARGAQSQASRQIPPNGGATSAVAVKHKDDSLPPLPADSNPPDVGSGKNLGLPAALHPGGRGGPRPKPPQNRNRLTSMGRPPPEILPEQLHRRTLSDTPTLRTTPLLSFSPPQTPMQSYPLEVIPRGVTPSIVVEQPTESHPPLAFPTPFISPPGPTQKHGLQGVSAAGDCDSFTYGPPGQVYVQPNSQGYAPTPTQGYWQILSPSQHPVPLQSPHTPPGQPQQLCDACPPRTSPPSQQQYTQYSSGPPTSQPPSPHQMYPQPHSTQLQQQQPPYPPQTQQQSSHQQPYSTSQQQQYRPQQLPYTPSPQVAQPYQQHRHASLSPSSQSPIAPPPPPLYSQTSQQPQQSYFAVPPPPPLVQPQTPQPYTPQPPPPQPPPPPPPLYSQGGQGPSIPVPIAQLSQTPVAPSRGPISPPAFLPQSAAPVAPPLQPPAATPLSPQIDPNTAPTASTEEIDIQRQVEEGRNEAKPVAVVEAGVLLEDVRSTAGDVSRNQTSGEESKKVVGEEEERLERPEDTEEQGAREEKECRQRIEAEERQRQEELRGQQELKRQQEEYLKQQEAEYRRREEEERRRMEEEERRMQEEEELKRREEFRRKEEEELRREEEARRRKEEEERQMREEEEERRKEEVERIQREHKEAERRRKAVEEEARQRRAEEAEAERRWQGELARIRARAEQEAADAAFARAQMDAEEAERRRQEEADLALVRQAQEEAEREEGLVQERRRQEEADMEVARREQAHEEELERRRREERRKRIEEADRELARRLDMELNLGTESNGGDQSQQRRIAGSGRH